MIHPHSVSLPELLSPAGNFEKMQAALHFGADAVYLAGKEFGMRSAAGNFSDEELFQAIQYAHDRKKRAYLALNAMPYQEEISRLSDYLERLSSCPPDALIVADLGVFSLCRKYLPGVPIHISTQAATVNADGCKAWYQMGAKRVVLARELSLKDISRICEQVPSDLEIEVFVHGSMCVSFSGRCLLSAYYTGRDANRGACTQPCRWNYHFTEDGRPDDDLTMEIHPEGSYIFGSMDLCMIDHLRELRDAGIRSFKIEGRMKSAYYAAAVTNAYRMVLDSLKGEEVLPNPDLFWRELESVTHRPYCTGYYFDPEHRESHLVESNGYLSENAYLTKVEREVEPGVFLCIQKNKFSVEEKIEFLSPGSFGQEMVVTAMTDENGEAITSCPHPKMRFYIQTDAPLKPGDVIRRKLQ